METKMEELMEQAQRKLLQRIIDHESSLPTGADAQAIIYAVSSLEQMIQSRKARALGIQHHGGI